MQRPSDKPAKSLAFFGKRKAAVCYFIFLILFHFSVRAQDLEARSYAVVPKGLHALAGSFTYSSGNVISGLTSPIQDLDVKTSAFGIAYVQTFSFFNKLARVALSLPGGHLSGTAKAYGVDTSGSRTGFYDGRIKFGVNLLGSPVMAPRDFRKFQEHTVLGASLVISVPIGQYYSDKLINMGTNRWGFKPEIGISHREGRFYYEMYTGVWFFTANNRYYKNTSQLDQKSLFSFQAHVDYVFKSSCWLAVNGGYADGGSTTLNGIERDDAQRNWRLGTTFSLPLNIHQSLKAMINTGVATRAGQNYTAYTIVYQYSWF